MCIFKLSSWMYFVVAVNNSCYNCTFRISFISYFLTIYSMGIWGGKTKHSLEDWKTNLNEQNDRLSLPCLNNSVLICSANCFLEGYPNLWVCEMLIPEVWYKSDVSFYHRNWISFLILYIYKEYLSEKEMLFPNRYLTVVKTPVFFF